MRDRRLTGGFGCASCCPDDAADAWEARAGFTTVADLIDESHYHVTIRACPACSQRFVSVFTETIDWVDGDDPQHWITLPLTEAEAGALIRQGSSVSESALNSLGSDRRCLRRDNPKSGESRTVWDTGLRVGPHD